MSRFFRPLRQTLPFRRPILTTSLLLPTYFTYSLLTSSPPSDASIDAEALYFSPSNPLRMESQVEGTLDRPSTMWTPPSREEMLRKLGAPAPASDAEHDGKGGKSGVDSEGAKADKSSSLQRAGSQDPSSTTSSREPPTSQRGLKGAPAGSGDSEKDDGEFDLLIVGGGATGAGVALDAAARGLKVGMVERDDFSSGAFSRRALAS